MGQEVPGVKPDSEEFWVGEMGMVVPVVGLLPPPPVMGGGVGMGVGLPPPPPPPPEDPLPAGGGVVPPLITEGAFTVSVKLVVLTTPPLVTVTVTVELLTGVEAWVVSVSVVVQSGVQDVDEKEALVPEGRPETEKTAD